MHRIVLIGTHSPRLNTVQWPGAVPEQRGHLQAFASQWRSRSTASGLDLLRKTEPQNILEGLWKKHDKNSYFSLCFLPSPLLLQCSVTSSVRLSQSSPGVWLPLPSVRAQPQHQHCPEDAGEKLHVPHGSTEAPQQQMPNHDISFRDMTFPLGTRLAASFI